MVRAAGAVSNHLWRRDLAASAQHSL